MTQNSCSQTRRSFFKTALACAAAGAASRGPDAGAFTGGSLQVWSCGGLAEAMIPANEVFEKRTGVKVAYTGAFAAALGKSLLAGGRTEVFAGRVLDLAKKLRKADKMAYFKPLCFTSYVVATPLGNPAGIQSVLDLARPGVRVALSPDASPPGGQAAQVLLKKAGIEEAVAKNTIIRGSCVQRTVSELISGKADASIIELRVSRLAEFDGKMDIIPIPEQFFPPPPLTFTVGVMNNASDRPLADAYVEFITSAEGQAFFERQGFIPAVSDKGQELIEKLGVKDV